MKLVEHSGAMGVITSPRYPNFLYLIDGRYTYRITVDIGYSVQISFDNCILKRDSKIVIYDGYDDSNSDILATQETDDISFDPIVSSSNVVFLAFSIATFSESKFKLIWNKISKTNLTIGNNTFIDNPDCTENSIVTIAPGTVLKVKSPGFPGGYDVNVRCKWTFIPSVPGYHVRIIVHIISLEASTDCIADYVQISSSHNVSDRICAPDPDNPVIIYHGDPNLKLEFVSDSYLNRSGFTADVECECGGDLSGPNGQISYDIVTRSFGQLGRSCSWLITVKRGRTIKFEPNPLWIMSKNEDGSCGNYITIRNGDSEESPFLGQGKYCGGHDITIPNTSGNKAYVRYVGDIIHSGHVDFFRLLYSQVEHDCGGEISLSASLNSTIISSPNYPNIPNPFIECIWKVTVPNGDLIVVDFLDRFDLTTTRNCSKEYVEIRDGSTTAAQLLGRFCDERPSTQTTTSNMARIHYFTDVSVPKNGFKARVSIAKCGGSFTSWRGFITSKNYPGLGTNHIIDRFSCTSNITIPFCFLCRGISKSIRM